MRVLRINDLHSIDRKAPQRQATFQLDIAPVTVRGMVIPEMSTATTVPPITMASAYPVRNEQRGARLRTLSGALTKDISLVSQYIESLAAGQRPICREGLLRSV
jgi:hypothetical protein